MRAMPIEHLCRLVKDEVRGNKLRHAEYHDDDRDWFIKTLDLMRQRYLTLKDFSAQGRAYFSDDFDFDEAAVSKNLKKEPRLREWLPALADRLEQVATFSAANVDTALRQFADEIGVKAGLFINASRTMLTG